MKKILFAVLAAFALVACDQEQSELSLDSIPGKGTIKGKVFYDAQGVVEGNQITNATIPADSVEVVVEVKYNEYDSNANGSKKYVTYTNKKGEYEVQIPVGSSPVNYTVYVRAFDAEYNGTTDDKGEILDNTAYYTSTPESGSVSVGDVEVVNDITMNGQAEDITKRNLVVTLTGKVFIEELVQEEEVLGPFDSIPFTDPETGITTNLPVYKYTGFEYVGAEKGCQTKLTITVQNGTKEIVYNNVATNADGSYSVNVNLYDDWDLAGTTVEVETPMFYVTNFKHHYCSISDTDKKQWNQQTLSGFYDSKSISSTLSKDNLFVKHEMSDINLDFRPENRDDIKGIGNIDVDYDEEGNHLYVTSNPLGW